MSLSDAMNPARSAFDPDTLLAHAGWLRSLARSLVPADVHLADDVVQDACLAALEKRPATDRPLGAWLATVVKNFVRQSRRGEAHRTVREQGAARTEAQPSTLDHVEKLFVHRELVEAVTELEEPYREAIVLRYFEELSPAAIARRQSVPVATVKTRLARGLDKLRARLDRRHGGDGRTWLLALIPVCKPAGGLAAPTLGALLVHTNLKIAIGIALVACGFFAVRQSQKHAQETPASAPAIAAPSGPRGAGAHEPAAPGAVANPEAERTAASPPPVAQPAAAAPAHAAARLSGRVLDVTQRPQAGLRVCFSAGRREISARELDVPMRQPSADAPAATTDATGSFALPLPDRDGEFVVDDPRWTTVLSSLCGPGSSAAEHIVVVAPHLEHAGYVVDETGQPIAQARIEIKVPRDLRAAFPHVLDNSADRSWIVQSDERGQFEFTDAPAVEGALLLVAHEGYGSLAQPAPALSDRALELVLRRPVAREGMIAGEVVDENGRPAAGAHVSLDHCAPVLTDEQGAFVIEVPKEGKREQWLAVKEGHQPAVEAASAAVKSGHPAADEFVTLHLGPPPLTIAGRVVDDEGHPQSGFKVFLADPTFFGTSDEVPTHVEGMLSGAATRADFERMLAGAPEGSDPEKLIKETSSVFWTFTRTDADGNFELKGLVDRSYRVAALDPTTLLRVDSDLIPAGTTNALLRLPKSAYVENVRGQVLTNAGTPVAGVKVAPHLVVLSVQLSESSQSSMSVDSQSVLTDAEGRFAFARLPRERVYLELSGEDILPLEWSRGDSGGLGVAAGEKPDQIEIRVQLRYHLQVEVAADVADQMRVVDARGGRVMINSFEGNSRMSTDALQLTGGRTPVLVVGEEARTLVLSKDGQEVSRVPLKLVAGQTNLVRL